VTIDIVCAECGKKYKIDAKFAGKKGKCKDCGTVFQVPMLPRDASEPDLSALDEASESSVSDAMKTSGRSAIRSSPVEAEASGRSGVRKSPAPARSKVDEAADNYGGYVAESGGGQYKPILKVGGNPIEEMIHTKMPIALIVLGYVAPLGFAAYNAFRGPTPTTGALVLAALLVLVFVAILPILGLGLKIVAKQMRFRLVETPGFKALAAFAPIPLIVALMVMPYGRPDDSSTLVSRVVLGSILGLMAAFGLVWLLFQLPIAKSAGAWGAAAVSFFVACIVTGLVLQVVVAVVGSVGGLIGGTPKQAVGPRPVPGLLGLMLGPNKQEVRAVSEYNLKAIGRGINEYAKGNKGAFPPDMNSLVGQGILDEATVRSLAGKSTTGEDYSLHTAPRMVAPAPPNVVVAYDASALDKYDGTVLLFGDGQVKWVEKDVFDETMAQADKARAVWIASLPAPETETKVAATPSVVKPTTEAAPTSTPVEVAVVTPQRPHEVVPVEPPVLNVTPSPFVSSVDDEKDVGDFHELIPPEPTGNAFLVIHRSGNVDHVERWSNDPMKITGRVDLRSESEPFGRSPYLLSPTGPWLLHLTNGARSIEIINMDTAQHTDNIGLGSSGFETELLGFMGPDIFTEYRRAGLEHGVQRHDAKKTSQAFTGIFLRSESMGGINTYIRQISQVNALSPDGKLLAYVVQRSFENGMQLQLEVSGLNDANKSTHVQIRMTGIDVDSGINPTAIAWSRDASHIAILYNSGQSTNLVISKYPPMGKQPQTKFYLEGDLPNLTAGGGRHFALDWLADGSAIVIGGQTLVHPDTGDVIGSVGIDKARFVWPLDRHTLRVVYQGKGENLRLATAHLDADAIAAQTGHIAAAPATKPTTR
jgi:hypothetical protein